MKKWYIVKSKFYDNGKIIANITGEIESIDEDKELDEICIKAHDNRVVSVVGHDLLVPDNK